MQTAWVVNAAVLPAYAGMIDTSDSSVSACPRCGDLHPAMRAPGNRRCASGSAHSKGRKSLRRPVVRAKIEAAVLVLGAIWS